MNNREAFEAEVKRIGILTSFECNEDGIYKFAFTQYLSVIWQAALAAHAQQQEEIKIVKTEKYIRAKLDAPEFHVQPPLEYYARAVLAAQAQQTERKPAGFISAKTVEWLNSIGEMIDAKMELTFRTEPSLEPYTIPFYLQSQAQQPTRNMLRPPRIEIPSAMIGPYSNVPEVATWKPTKEQLEQIKQSMNTVQAKNWEEDYADGKNKYLRVCSLCKENFYGYKRRVVCKVCDALQAQTDRIDEVGETMQSQAQQTESQATSLLLLKLEIERICDDFKYAEDAKIAIKKLDFSKTASLPPAPEGEKE